jgi:hypothetical protein
VKKEQLAELLKAAKDESTPEDVLTDIWYSTTSVRVRKAVASNPNASSQVLKIASRLYLEEVLENPGFQMIQMFDTDLWVGKVYEAYEDPNAFFMKYGKYQSVGINGDLYNRAILLSKNLTPEALNCCLAFGSKSALDRTLKNKAAVAKIKNLSRGAIYSKQIYCPFELESILMLYKVGVIDQTDLMQALSMFGIASTSAKKRLYSDFFNKTLKEYSESKSEKEKSFLVKLFSKLIMISRGHTLHWIDYWQMRSPEKIDFIAKVLKTIRTAAGEKYLLSDHRRTFVGILCSYAINKLNVSPRKTGDFEAVYEFFHAYALEDSLGEFRAMMNLRPQEWVKEIEDCSIRAKEFFIRSGSLGTWVAMSESDKKYQIFNEVNNDLYERSGLDNLIFNSCSMRKIVTIDDSTHIY